MQQQCTTALENARNFKKSDLNQKNLIFSIFLIKNHDFFPTLDETLWYTEE